MTREELQSQTISLIEEYDRVAVQWCTGLGKSRAAIQMANYLIDRNAQEGSNCRILLVVAETAHKKNWEDEFKKWKLKHCNLVIECYASLKKYRNTFWDLIIFDEAHHLGSDLRIDVSTDIVTEKVILLSATLPDQIMQSITTIFGEFVTTKVTLGQAIEEGLLPRPRVYLVPLELDNKEPSCTIIEEWGRKERRVVHKCKFHERWEYLKNKSKYPNVTLEISCTQKQKYDYLSDQFDYWRNQYFRTRQEFIMNKWLQAGSKRKRFLGESKTGSVKNLLRKIRNRRFICFCTSIEQADLLGRNNAIHSKRDDSLTIIEKFNNKEINNLFAVGMLQEGQNLTDIEIGVIIQLDGEERAFIQKFGRSMRAEDPIQFIFYYRNTRDEDYLRNILEGINEDHITEIDNLSDLEI